MNSAECVTDLDKLNLLKLGYGGLVLGLRQFLRLPQLAPKTLLASKGLEDNHLALLVSIHDTLCK